MMPVINEDEAADDSDAEGEEETEDESNELLKEDESQGEFDSELIDEATKLVRVENKATVSLLQRRLKLGYSAAARLMERLEELGVVGPFNGSDPREVLPFDVPEDLQAG